ncbi:DUF7408 domain-containing protein [Hazenella coriacea]|uniref:Uncharacterized protein n=1 Tax=Hazenella coriacea TaxID=1179467 RepID=A0A4R3LHI1_9BACL|nr:hypothetical protein [Hazenella coriacea]TCS96976.1 hypothetical protein EDD58_101623 [Hazenella coriacea]
MRWLKYLLIFIIGSLCVMSNPIQASAESKVQLQVEPGWNGEYKGEFIPVKVRVTSQGGEVEGQLMVQPPKLVQSEPSPTTQQKESIKVPSGSTKEVVLYIPRAAAFPTTQIVWVENDKVVQSVKMGGRQLGETDLAIGYLSDNPNDASVWNQMFASSNSDVRVYTYPIQVKDLPIQSRGLSGFDTIVINRLTSESISPKQMEALQLWVANGGKLVLSGSNSSELIRGFSSILPVQDIQSGTQLKNLQSLNQWGAPPAGQIEVKGSRLKKGSSTLLQTEGIPLIAQGKFDQGKVYFASYDLLAEPMKQWSGYEKIWSHQLISLDMKQDDYEGRNEFIRGGAGLLNQSFIEFDNYPTPSIGVIVIVFVIYLILGPIIYWVLSRKRKHEWMWVAVPIVSIIFATGFLIYGQWIHGQDVLINTIGYIEVENGEQATVRAASAIVSQEEGDYSVVADNGFIWNRNIGEYGLRKELESTVSFQNKPKITFQNVPQWSTRNLYTESIKKMNGTLTGSIQITDQGSKGTVTNQTDLLMEDVKVMVGDQTLPIGNLKPGESKPFSSNIPIQMVTPNSQPPFVMGEEMSLKKIMLYDKQDELSTISMIDVVGFTRENLIKLEVENQTIEQSSLFLVNGKMDIQPMSDGTLKAPFGVIDSSIIHSTVPYQMFTGSGIYIESSGTFTFEFDLSEWNIKELSELSIQPIRSDLEVYDWVHQQWVGLKTPNLEKIALSPDQKIQIRVKGDANVEVEKPTIQVRGRVSQ